MTTNVPTPARLPGVAGLGIMLLALTSMATAATPTATERDEEVAAASGEEVPSTPDQSLTTVFDEILIGAPMAPLVGPERELGHDEITEIPYGDAAEVLRAVSGMAVGRMAFMN